jgi:hypothetical protein
VWSIKPDYGSSEVNGAEKGRRAFVVSGCDASELLEFGEGILRSYTSAAMQRDAASTADSDKKACVMLF